MTDAAVEKEKKPQAKAADQVTSWRDAAEAVVRLQDVPNQELRGRTTDAALERIDKFIKRDPIYRSMRDEFAGDSRALKIEFRETVERALSILERLAHRNRDVELPVDLADQSKYVYRMVAIHVLLERTGRLHDATAERSVLGLPTFGRPDLPREVGSDSAKSEGATVALPQEPRADSSIAATPAEERIFDLSVPFLNGRLASIKEQHELLRGMTQFQDGKSFPFLRIMMGEKDLPHGILLEQLQRVGQIADECKQFGDGTRHTVSSACLLYDKVRNITKNWGLGLVENPFEAMVQDEFLSPSGKERLIRSFEVMRDAHPIARDIVLAIEKKYVVSPEHVAQLSEAVTRMLLAKKPEEFVRSRIEHALLVGPDRIAHVNNCASLALRKVHINDLLVISPEGTAIIARAAAGDFDRVPQTDSHYGANVRERIDVELRILRNADPGMRGEFERALAAIDIPANVSKSEIRNTLFTIGTAIPPESREVRLLTIGTHLKVLAAGGANLERLDNLFREAPEEVGVAGLLRFVSDLAHLQQEGVSGVPTLLNNAYLLAEQRRAGNQNCDCRGAIIEASTAMNLERAGYKIIALSLTLDSSRYDYDILANSPTGERLGIEVKRGLGTIVGKNARMWKSADHDSSQLVRFMKACKQDGFTPCIAIHSFGDSVWAASPVTDLLSQIASEFGKRPRMLNGQNGQVVNY